MMSATKEWYDLAVTDLGVAIRYPNELFLEERHADKAIQYADEIVKWIADIVNASGDELA